MNTTKRVLNTAAVCRTARVSFALAATAAVFFASAATAENLPLERVVSYHWTYEELDKLVTAGALPLHTAQARPCYRVEIANALRRLDTDGTLTVPARRMRREYDLEISGLRSGGSEHQALLTRSYDREVLEAGPYVRYFYRRNKERSSLYRVGFRAAAEFSPSVLFYQDIYIGNSGDDMPFISRRYSFLVEGQDFNWWDHRFYVTARVRGFTLSLGRDWIRWGPGNSGTLALSDNARALNFLSLEKDFGGFVRASNLVSVLDFATKESLAGHRLEFSIGRRVTLGLSETSLHRGGSATPLYLLGIVPYPLIEVLISSDTCSGDAGGVDSLHGCPSGVERQLQVKNNIMWSADVQVLPAAGFRTYAEVLIDDLSFSSEYKPLQAGFQLGGHLTHPVLPWKSYSLRAEYTRVYNYVYSVWYHHDYIFHNRALGYALGPDSEDVLLRLTVDPVRNLSFWLDIERQRHGEGRLGVAWDEGRLTRPSDSYEKKTSTSFEGTVETAYRTAVTGRMWLADRGTISLSCGYLHVENEENQAGQEHSSLLLEAELQVSL